MAGQKSVTGDVGGEFGQLPQDNFPYHLRLRRQSLIQSLILPPDVSLPLAAGHTSSMPVTEYAWPFTRPNGVRASDSAALLVCNRGKSVNEPLFSEWDHKWCHLAPSKHQANWWLTHTTNRNLSFCSAMVQWSTFGKKYGGVLSIVHSEQKWGCSRMEFLLCPCDFVSAQSTFPGSQS